MREASPSGARGESWPLTTTKFNKMIQQEKTTKAKNVNLSTTRKP